MRRVELKLSHISAFVVRMFIIQHGGYADELCGGASVTKATHHPKIQFIADQRVCANMCQLPADFVLRETRVERDKDRAHARDGMDECDKCLAVLQQHCDAVACMNIQ